MAKMQTKLPTQKVVASTFATALSTILIFFIEDQFRTEALPPSVTTSITTVLVFIVGYFTPPLVRDQLDLAPSA